MNFDYKIIEERMKSLPEDLQKAMVSVDTADIILDIAEKNGLDIDQAGKLSDMTSYVMLGLIPSKRFVAELAKSTEISEVRANTIAQEINSQVFGEIRASLQKMQANEIPQAKETTQNPQNTAADQQKVLNAIEDPSTTASPASPINLLSELPLIISGEKSHPTVPSTTTPVTTAPIKSINLMDQFMAAPVNIKNETVEKKVDTKPAPSAPVKPRQTGPDPYREPIQ